MSHLSGNPTYNYFCRLLLLEVISQYKFTLPEGWAKNYFAYTLFCNGYIAIFETDKFGVIPQQCTLQGYDVQYQPTHAVISNPLLSGITTPRIGAQCAIVKLSPDYRGIMDIVTHYAGQMALAVQAITLNLQNSKLGYVMGTTTKRGAETLKKMFDQLQEGSPAVFTDTLYDSNGNPRWQPFEQHLKQNYLVADLVSDLRKIHAMFLTDIGVPNANTDKRERLNTAEVNANNEETYSKIELFAEEIEDGFKRARKLWPGLTLGVELRNPPERSDGNAERDTVDTRAI